MKKVMVAAILSLIFCLGLVSGSASSLPVAEMALDTAGEACELNADAQGWLWVTDYALGQIWGVNPSGGKYEIYNVTGNPGDARRVGDNLWWVDQTYNIYGRASTVSGAYTTWQSETSDYLYGTAVDASSRLWATELFGSTLYRFDPADPQGATECAFVIPGGVMSSYLISDGGDTLWFEDYLNGRLLRINTDSGALSWWTLPTGASPNGLALDADGNVWYADTFNGEVAVLFPGAEMVRRYALPQNSMPWMVTLQDGQVWFTDQGNNTIGKLYPAIAAYTEENAREEASTTIVPTCAKVNVVNTGTLSHPPQDIIMEPVTYDIFASGPGYTMYQLPIDAYPWGIADTDLIWFVDTGRAVLGSIDPFNYVFLPLILR
jgi:streptogramin lyase